jgi:pimeloyl-ACP methyl ester carboxylesterase
MKNNTYQWGNKENTTLVLLHGMGGTGLKYGELAGYLNDFHIVAFDLAGHGGATSFEREEDYYPSSIVKYTNELITEMNISDFYLVGHSWGAHVALYYAKMYSDKVKGIILLDGGYIPDSEISSLDVELEQIEKFYENIRFPSWEAFIASEKSELDRWSEELEAGSKSQVKEIDGEIRLATSIFTAKAVVKGIYAEPTKDILKEIASPTLLLLSSFPDEMNDIREAGSKEFISLVKNVTVRTIPDTTHNIYVDAPQEVADYMKRWIQYD